MSEIIPKINRSPLSPNVIGAFWMLGSVFGFLASNVAVKFAGESLPSMQIVFLRCFLQILILLPFICYKGFRTMKSTNIKNYAFRLVFGVTNISLMFYAVTHLNFATAISLVFSRPLFTILLAALLLKERVGLKRGLATLFGFIGILIVLNPSVDFSLAEMAALGSSFFLASAYIYIQKLSRTENHIAMLMWFAVSAAVISCPFAVMEWHAFGLKTLGVIFAISACATLAQYCIIRAYQVGKSTIISPLEYLQIPLSALVGFLFFNEDASRNFAIGSLIIILTSLYILRKKQND